MERLSRSPRTRFFLAAAYFTLAVALAGFAKTFFAPLVRGTFAAPAVVYLHAAVLFGWMLLFVMQAVLVRQRRPALHRRLGWIALLLAAGVVWSTLRIGVLAMHRGVANGAGPTAVSELVGVCSTMLIYTLLVALAVACRRRPDAHKRLMLLATIAILWPAWFRFRHYFPSVPFPEIVFAIAAANALVLVAMLHDRVRRGRVHPVNLWGGTALIAEQSLEAAMFDSPAWRVLAQWLAAMLG
jgi:uncharacterized membrane protein